MQINPEVLQAALSARLLSVKDAAERADIPLATLYQILGWRGRRDENGLVNIGPETGRKLRQLLDEVAPVISLVREPQGPPKRRIVATDMTSLGFGLDERVRLHEERERKKHAPDSR